MALDQSLYDENNENSYQNIHAANICNCWIMNFDFRVSNRIIKAL